MRDRDFHAQEVAEYPWRIDISLDGDSIKFSGTSADLTQEDAHRQGLILLQRFNAKKAIVTPIIVSRKLSPPEIAEKTQLLTIILEPKDLAMLQNYNYQDPPPFKRINILVGEDRFLRNQRLSYRINQVKRYGCQTMLSKDRPEKKLNPLEQIEFVNDIITKKEQYVIATHSETIVRAFNTHLQFGHLKNDDQAPLINPLSLDDFTIHRLELKGETIIFTDLVDPNTGLISEDYFLADKLLRDRLESLTQC